MFQSALDPAVLLLAKELFKDKELVSDFYMAGGTALCLHLGHRKSEDIDLFSENKFNEESLSRNVLQHEKSKVVALEEGTLHVLINNIKLSFLYYPYPLLCPLITEGPIKLASVEDIACMKAVSISQRDEKKDFFDMYEILKTLKPTEIKELFLKKYGERRINCYHILRSFFFFDDAEETPEPVSLNGTDWGEVKKYFSNREKEWTDALLC